jgi:hypothetical protein
MANWIKTIDNDVKEKNKTSPLQTYAEKAMQLFIERNKDGKDNGKEQ